ncbi:His Kinase A (phospho-acceptor) domain-containing protein [Cyclonatronum proteinivorum]|uniref:histidine kinase n=2 Tax=Cyclonatronum proteinivorum TaxID=1457365 RepID=A0A345UGX7_9BACT|nr:His Kinase A (phospho-acceptor) domain-containing protein [Cyclonatronum proteinivorum]
MLPAFLVTVLLLLSANPLQYFSTTEKPEYLIRHYTTSDGLPLNSVIGMIQSADGFLYMTTLDGLVRYDGYEFKTYTTEDFPGLVSNRLQYIGIEEDERIWLGTTYGIVSSFDGYNFRTFDPAEPHPFNLQQSKESQFLALGTALGTVIKARRTGLTSRYVPQLGSLVSVDDNFVKIDGQIILETTAITGAFADDKGTIWISTYNEGLFQIRPSLIRNITEMDGLSVGNTYSVVELPTGEIVAGSLSGGTLHFGPDGFRRTVSDTSNDNLNQSRFIFYDEAEGVLYKSFFAPQLLRYESGTWVTESWFQELLTGSDSRVDAMHRGRNGTLFVGSPRGMAVKQGDSVSMIDALTGYNFRYVRVIRELDDGSLFLGTNGHGLYRLNPDWSWVKYTTEDGLRSNYIRDIYLKNEDEIWLATEGDGLNLLQFNDRSEIRKSISITRQTGLNSNSLHRIIADNYGNVWLNSNNGIMRISKEQIADFTLGELQTVTPFIFNEQNGLVNREGNGGVGNAGLKLRNGLIVFPGQAGLVLINPSDFNASRFDFIGSPTVDYLVTPDQLLRNNLQGGFSLERGERSFRIHFTIPNFEHPEAVTFHHHLMGFDAHPHLTSETRTAYYTNVTPGTYQFQVTATGYNGQVAQVSVPVYIPPYFYETTLFYFFSGLGIIFLGVLAYRRRIYVYQKKQERLRLLVEEKTAELTKANAEVRKAAQAKSRLFSSISHELKTPLSLISGPLEEISRHHTILQNTDLHRQLEMVQENTFKLTFLVDQIMDVTKLNADALRLKFKPVNLPELTQSLLYQLSAFTLKESVKLELRAEPANFTVWMDEHAWDRIITNLVCNALRFTPSGSTIRVALHQNDKQVRCLITDEGPGIHEADLPHIFDYLYQGNGNQGSDGTGIGLYLVKGLVERAGGTIRAFNHEQGGAVFELRLKNGSSHLNPADLDDYSPKSLRNQSNTPELPDIRRITFAPTPAVKPEASEDETFVTSEKPHLLITDDNADYRSFLSSILSKHFSISEAPNGHAALAQLEKLRPDLIISDVMMPGMDGITLVSNIRSLPQFKTVPVLFISAKSDQDDIAIGLSSGADVYLTKPVSPEIIRKQVFAMLRREKLIKKTELPQKVASNGKLQRNENSGTETVGVRLKGAESHKELEHNIRELILRHMGNSNLNAQLIADSLYISRAQLYRKWEQTGTMSINKYITKMRIEEACHLMEQENYTVSEAANAVGYKHASYFSTLFKKETGLSPSEWLDTAKEKA